MDFFKSEGETDSNIASIQIKTENYSSEEEQNDSLLNTVEFKPVIQPLRSFPNCTTSWGSGEIASPKVNYCVVKVEDEMVQVNSVTPYKCEMCNSTYDGLASFEVHLEDKHGLHIKHEMHDPIYTGGKTYKCNVCSYSSNQSSNLKKHQITHTAEKPYKCDECTASFTQKGSLRRHKIICTEERVFNCDACTASFTQKCLLKVHKMTHAEENPFSCDECTSIFSTKGNLKRHKMIHSGERPYKCDECNTSFTQSGSLKKHKVVHTGERPYMCDVCTSTFTETGSLNKHKLIHTRKKASSRVKFHCKRNFEKTK